MIRSATVERGDDRARPAVNALRGEFIASIAGEPCRFDTRLATIAAIEEACGDRPIVEVLNGIVLGRRARDLIPLVAAALSAAEPWRADAAEVAAQATIEEAETFMLALLVALGFTVEQGHGEASPPPLDDGTDGDGGASSPSAA